MTCVCSVGLDMIAVPGDTSAETISAIIADEAAIGMVNSKTTAVRIIPAPGKNRGGHGGVRRAAGLCPGDPGASLLLRPLHPAGRADPRPHAEPEELRPGGRPLVAQALQALPLGPASGGDPFWTSPEGAGGLLALYVPYGPYLFVAASGRSAPGECLPAASISHVRNGGKNTRGFAPGPRFSRPLAARSLHLLG